jgi:hypothetical protein
VSRVLRSRERQARTPRRLLDKVVSILARLQALQHVHPVAYLLENVAIQENFRYPHIREQVAAEVNTKNGTPITFDAAHIGSYAARLRNYWTNIASQHSMQAVYKDLRMPKKGNLYDVLEPGRHPMPVTMPSRDGHNQVGKVRQTFANTHVIPAVKSL